MGKWVKNVSICCAIPNMEAINHPQFYTVVSLKKIDFQSNKDKL